MSWRNVSIVLAVLCVYQTWRGCSRSAPPSATTSAGECATASGSVRTRTYTASRDDAPAGQPSSSDDATESPPGLPSINGFKLPAWTLWFAPMPGESMLSYRDRMVPIAQAALAPHRARVARGRDDFAAKVKLDTQQRAELDAAVQEAATAIQDRAMDALLGGQLSPKTFKPMTGVALARDVLDAVDRANRRFVATLREDQKTTMAQHPFDFADYLLFSARWEDALGVTN